MCDAAHDVITNGHSYPIERTVLTTGAADLNTHQWLLLKICS